MFHIWETWQEEKLSLEGDKEYLTASRNRIQAKLNEDRKRFENRIKDLNQEVQQKKVKFESSIGTIIKLLTTFLLKCISQLLL